MQPEKEKKKYNFRGGRYYSAWWELRPGSVSLEMERKAKRVAEVGKKYNVKIDYVNGPWGNTWPGT